MLSALLFFSCDGLLSSEFGVLDALPDGVLEGPCEPLTVVHLALVEPERLFIEVAELSGLLISRGFEKEADRGLAAMLKTMKKHSLVHEIWIQQIDELRLRRNPFVHAKEPRHKNSVHEIARAKDEYFLKTLEDTAYKALALMYGVVFEMR